MQLEQPCTDGSIIIYKTFENVVINHREGQVACRQKKMSGQIRSVPGKIYDYTPESKSDFNRMSKNVMNAGKTRNNLAKKWRLWMGTS
jgi:hypothetical protein